MAKQTKGFCNKVRRLHSECITCMAKVHLAKHPIDADEEKKIEYMQKVLEIIANAPYSAGAPVVVRSIYQLQEKMFGMKQDYKEVKKHFNQIMLGYEEKIKERIMQSEEMIKTGIQYAMIGNYIDFGAMVNVNEEELTQLLEHPDTYTVEEKQYQELKKDLSKAKSMVYFTDNCGEIVMDKLLIQAVLKQYPKLKVTVIVRGAEVLNDATIEDAIQVGMDDIAEVISNGSDIAGTWLEEISKEARTVIQSADVMIAKGQGNFETLRKCGKNIYYIFLCKCDLFSKEFKVPKLTGILINEKYCN